MKKCSILALLATATGSVYADDFVLNVEGANGQINASCGTTAIISPYTYEDNTCELKLERVVDGTMIEIPLGTCPVNNQMSIVIDNHMYQFNVDATFYNNLIGQEDVLLLSVPIGNCVGNNTATTDFALYTDTDIIQLDPNFGAIWAVDANNKPVVILRSSTGNTICQGGVPVSLNNTDDLIFANSFE